MSKKFPIIPVSIVLLLISYIYLAYVANILPQIPLSLGGATVLNLVSTQYSTSPNPNDPAQFSSVWTSQVLLGYGQQTIYGGQPLRTNVSQLHDANSNVQSADNFATGFELEELGCRYPIQNSQQTLSNKGFYVNQMPNSRQRISSNPWYTASQGDACLILTDLSDPFGTDMYVTTTDDAGNRCEVLKANIGGYLASECSNAYQSICAGTGNHILRCTPSLSYWGQIQPYRTTRDDAGFTCGKIDNVPNDYIVQWNIQPKNTYATAKITEEKNDGNRQEIHLSVGGCTQQNCPPASNFTNHISATMLTNFGSYSQDCPTEGGNTLARYQWQSQFSYVIPQSRVSSLQTLIDSFVIEDRVTRISTMETTLLNYQNQYDQIFDSESSGWDTLPPGSRTIQTESDGVGAIWVDRSMNPHVFPVIMLYIDAVWAGIVNPIAIPSLSQVSPNPVIVTSGESNTAFINVTNTAQNGGGIEVDIPTCPSQSGASSSWSINPGGAFTAGETKQGAFSITCPNVGTYTCGILARSTGIPPGQDNHETSRQFTLTCNPACMNQCTPPMIRSPIPEEPCRCVCPITPPQCAQQGKILNNATGSCECISCPAGTHFTNGQCIPDTQTCSDGTDIGQCSINHIGQRCNNNRQLVDDVSCLNICTSCSDGTHVNQCADLTGNRCILQGTNCNLVSDITCPTELTCPVGQHLDTNGNCVPNIPFIDGTWIVIGIFVLVIGAGLYDLARKKRR